MFGDILRIPSYSGKVYYIVSKPTVAHAALVSLVTGSRWSYKVEDDTQLNDPIPEHIAKKLVGNLRWSETEIVSMADAYLDLFDERNRDHNKRKVT